MVMFPIMLQASASTLVCFAWVEGRISDTVKRAVSNAEALVSEDE